MHIGVPLEPAPETRVALVPSNLRRLSRAGFEVSVERGAGSTSHYSDADYEEAGARVVSREEVLACPIVASLGVVPELGQLASGTVCVCVADPFRYPDTVRTAMGAGLTLLSLDLIPRRLSRAQSMDVSSSQDNLSGYQAVLLGAAHVGRALPMMTTSAGTVKPGKAVVMGSGVAGLQAIATAKRLGAIVYGSDVRLAAKEQIESVGGRFIHVDGMEDFEDASGYAKPLTAEFIAKVNDAVCAVAEDADLVVTTARIFGRPAPITVPAEAVARFRSGAVVVDMNADTGGNCAVTRPDETFTTDGGVTIIGASTLARRIPHTASMLYGNNVTALLTSLVSEGALVLSDDDEILVGPAEGSPLNVPGMGGVLACRDGVLHSHHTRLEEVIA